MSGAKKVGLEGAAGGAVVDGGGGGLGEGAPAAAPSRGMQVAAALEAAVVEGLRQSRDDLRRELEAVRAELGAHDDEDTIELVQRRLRSHEREVAELRRVLVGDLGNVCKANADLGLYVMELRDLVEESAALAQHLLDTGRCPECGGGECETCNGLGIVGVDNDKCGVCGGNGQAAHAEDCGLATFGARAQKALKGGA